MFHVPKSVGHFLQLSPPHHHETSIWLLLLLCTVLFDHTGAAKSPGQSVKGMHGTTTTTDKVIEIEHIPVVEKIGQAHPKPIPIMVEEVHHHHPHPESHVEFSPEQIIHFPVKGHPSPSVGSHPYTLYPDRSVETSRPNTHFLLQVVPSSVRRRHESGIPDLLAVLAPLAAIPLLGSLAVSSFTTMLTLTGLGRRRRRRRRDLTLHHDVLHQLTASGRPNVSLLHLDLFGNDNNHSKAGSDHQPNPFDPLDSPLNASSAEDQHSQGSTFAKDLPIFGDVSQSVKSSNPISELFQLDVVQQYLRQSGRPDHNDQIIASYLACRGLFAEGNHCLERLACHYSDMQNGRLKPLERDVAALIIYSLLRNGHIDSTFKRRLQRAALFGYDHNPASGNNAASGSNDTESGGGSSSPFEASFVPVCDREFPCPKSEMP